MPSPANGPVSEIGAPMTTSPSAARAAIGAVASAAVEATPARIPLRVKFMLFLLRERPRRTCPRPLLSVAFRTSSRAGLSNWRPAGRIGRLRNSFDECAGGLVLDGAGRGHAQEFPGRAHVLPVVEEQRRDRDDELAETEDVLVVGELPCGGEIDVAMTALNADEILPGVALRAQIDVLVKMIGAVLVVRGEADQVARRRRFHSGRRRGGIAKDSGGPSLRHTRLARSFARRAHALANGKHAPRLC